MKVAIIVGTRPQFVKLRPLMAAKPEGVEVTVLHTGQHYSPEMGEPGVEHVLATTDVDYGKEGYSPDVFDLGDGVAIELVKVPRRHGKPDWALVIGDCRSTLAGALAAAEAGIPVAHLEAGLRCWAPTVEERIRRAVDHYSDLCLCPTRTAMDNLERERYAGRAVQVGDILVDALQGQRVLVTMHRAENEAVLSQVLEAVQGFDVTWVTHPRYAIAPMPGVKFLPPQSEDDFLRLMARSAVVVTDSGGVSREAALLGKPVLLVRDTYEFREELPGVRLVKPAQLGATLGVAMEKAVTPLGDGRTAGRVWEELAR